MQNASDDAFSPFVTQVCHPGIFDISSVILCFLTRDSSNTQIIATYLPTTYLFFSQNICLSFDKPSF